MGDLSLSSLDRQSNVNAYVQGQEWSLPRRTSLLSRRTRHVEINDNEDHRLENIPFSLEIHFWRDLTVHQIENKTKFIGCMKCIGHTDNKWTSFLLEHRRGDERTRRRRKIERLTPVLTRESMMRSFNANVSPCFILIRFLSRHFIAYLKTKRVDRRWATENYILPVSALRHP